MTGSSLHESCSARSIVPGYIIQCSAAACIQGACICVAARQGMHLMQIIGTVQRQLPGEPVPVGSE